MGDSPYYLDSRKITLADFTHLIIFKTCALWFGKLAIKNMNIIKLITVLCVSALCVRVFVYTIFGDF